jgi:osmotically inducible protein OsmC
MNLLIPKALVPKKRERKRSVGPEVKGTAVKERATFLLRVPIKNDSDTAASELLVAALARSFSLALASELGLKACAVGEIVTIATATLEELTAGWTITTIQLDVVARLPKVNQGRFIDATVCAKTSCLVARSLRANISMNARLER